MADALARLPTEIVLIVLLMFLLLGLFGWALYTLFYGARSRLKRRVAMVAGSANAKGKQARIGGGLKRRSIQNRLKQLDQSRQKSGHSELRDQLMLAGLRIEVLHYLLANAGLGLLAAFIYATTAMPRFGIPLVGLVVGLGVPKLAITIMGKRRVGKFTSAFAEGLDIVVRGIRSGLPLGECINIIGREMADPLGAEFRLISEGQKLGMTLQDTLARAVERMPTAELKFFAIVLTIQQQTGGNLAETLSKLSEVLRARKRMRDKIQAYSSEAKASAMIIGSLPVVVTALLSVVAPDYVGVLFTTDTGNVLVVIGVSVMMVGALVMRQMIHFDI